MVCKYAGLQRLVNRLNAEGNHGRAAAAQAAHDQAISEGADKSQAFNRAMRASVQVVQSTSESASSTTTGATLDTPQPRAQNVASSAATGSAPAAARNSKRKSAPETSLPKPAKKPRAESATAISREDLLKRLSQKETQHAKDLYTIITKEDVNTAQWSRNTALTILVESQDVKLKDLQQKLIDKDLAISRLSNQVADYRILVEELRERIAILEGQNKIGEDVQGEISSK